MAEARAHKAELVAALGNRRVRADTGLAPLLERLRSGQAWLTANLDRHMATEPCGDPVFVRSLVEWAALERLLRSVVTLADFAHKLPSWLLVWHRGRCFQPLYFGPSETSAYRVSSGLSDRGEIVCHDDAGELFRTRVNRDLAALEETARLAPGDSTLGEGRTLLEARRNRASQRGKSGQDGVILHYIAQAEADARLDVAAHLLYLHLRQLPAASDTGQPGNAPAGQALIDRLFSQPEELAGLASAFSDRLAMQDDTLLMIEIRKANPGAFALAEASVGDQGQPTLETQRAAGHCSGK